LDRYQLRAVVLAANSPVLNLVVTRCTWPASQHWLLVSLSSTKMIKVA